MRSIFSRREKKRKKKKVSPSRVSIPPMYMLCRPRWFPRTGERTRGCLRERLEYGRLRTRGEKAYPNSTVVNEVVSPDAALAGRERNRAGVESRPIHFVSLSKPVRMGTYLLFFCRRCLRVRESRRISEMRLGFCLLISLKVENRRTPVFQSRLLTTMSAQPQASRDNAPPDLFFGFVFLKHHVGATLDSSFVKVASRASM